MPTRDEPAHEGGASDLPPTAYALLGLLTFGEREVTGYELKQRADMTLRFYWASPAMSQIYTELRRLADRGLVLTVGTGRATRYRISAAGRRALSAWMARPAGFPVWKHPVALRLIIGHLSDPETLQTMLRDYVEEVALARRDLQNVRELLRGEDTPGGDLRFPSLVADWGLAHFDSEAAIATELLARLEEDRAAAIE